MAEAIRMPLLSDTMTEGVIAAWHKKVGDTVKADDVLADVETDKATMEVTPYVDGTLLYVGVEQGKAAKVNDIIAIIGNKGEDFQSLLDGDKAKAAPAAAPAQAEQPKAEAPTGQPKAEAPANAAAPAPSAPAPKSAPAPSAAPPDPGAATVIRMPLLSDTMTEGKIVAWHKKVGDTIKADDVLAEVETDKATMEVVPYVDGTLLYLGVEAGTAAKVNDIIAIVGKAGTDVQPYLNDGGSAAPAAAEPAAAAPAEGQPKQEAAAQPAEQTEAAPEASSNERLKASPLAKRLAEDKGIDLQQVKGSGDNGRVIKRDIDSFKPAAASAAPQQPAAAASAAPQKAAQPASVPAPPAGVEGYTDIPNSQMRNVIAKRLSQSMFTAPHFYLHISVTMDKAIAARKTINEISPAKVSFNDLVIKAAAMALRKHPAVNSSWMSARPGTDGGDFIRQNHHINIGSAVAVEDGLIVPVIRFADTKSLSQIAQEASGLYEKAKNKKLQPPEFSGNTFTVSNLGMLDIDEFTSIINAPDGAILSVGKITPTPVVENDQVVIRQVMKLTLGCDHRVVDGSVGAKFLQTLKAYIENPVTMLA